MIGNQKNIQNLLFNYEHTARTVIKTVKNAAITKKRNRYADNRKKDGVREILYGQYYYE